jgi:hypothetical protein
MLFVISAISDEFMHQKCSTIGSNFGRKSNGSCYARQKLVS